MRVRVVEDETKAAAYLARGLAENAIVVDLAVKGDEGLRLARTGHDDLIILDVMLPTGGILNI